MGRSRQSSGMCPGRIVSDRNSAGSAHRSEHRRAQWHRQRLKGHRELSWTRKHPSSRKGQARRRPWFHDNSSGLPARFVSRQGQGAGRRTGGDGGPGDGRRSTVRSCRMRAGEERRNERHQTDDGERHPASMAPYPSAHESHRFLQEQAAPKGPAAGACTKAQPRPAVEDMPAQPGGPRMGLEGRS